MNFKYREVSGTVVYQIDKEIKVINKENVVLLL